MMMPSDTTNGAHECMAPTQRIFSVFLISLINSSKDAGHRSCRGSIAYDSAQFNTGRRRKIKGKEIDKKTQIAMGTNEIEKLVSRAIT
mmetsp:Transcript_18681/g.21427  ORF Transcript_18681/g.21427 Transcript_18681/m.21427 type:complete len:88 (-) Transcript_18681:1166-1429(-)